MRASRSRYQHLVDHFIAILNDVSTQIDTYVDNIRNALPNLHSEKDYKGPCSGVNIDDHTCGEECFLKYPQSFGDKSFGFDPKAPWQSKVSNAHQIHAYQNVRASMPGQGPASTGPYEWIPRVVSYPPTNSIIMSPEPVYDQVGNFLNLPQYSNLRDATFRG